MSSFSLVRAPICNSNSNNNNTEYLLPPKQVHLVSSHPPIYSRLVHTEQIFKPLDMLITNFAMFWYQIFAQCERDLIVSVLYKLIPLIPNV